MISIIVATDENLLIGQKNSKNGLPWNLPEDLKHFKETTMGKTVLFGLNTYLAMGKVLPNRHTIVLSFDKFAADGIEVRYNLEEVINEFREKQEDLFICGGASIYKQALPLVDQLLISRVPGSHEGETYFPDYSQYGFKLIEEKEYNTFKLQTYRK